EPNSDFVRALRDRVTHDAENPRGREQERDAGEKRDQNRVEARLRDGWRDVFTQQPRTIKRRVFVEFGHGVAQQTRQGGWTDTAADEERHGRNRELMTWTVDL